MLSSAPGGTICRQPRWSFIAPPLTTRPLNWRRLLGVFCAASTTENGGFGEGLLPIYYTTGMPVIRHKTGMLWYYYSQNKHSAVMSQGMIYLHSPHAGLN